MASNDRLFRDYIKGLQTNLSLGNATEHTHRPVLKTMLESVGDRVTATNEPKRVECGAPDFVITKAVQNQFIVGYVEAKDVGHDLEQIERDSRRANPSTTNGRQFKRYRESLPNLLLTNYTEFRWYVDGEPRMNACLATLKSDGRLSRNPAEFSKFNELLWEFLNRTPERIASPENLAQRMARLTHMIRSVIEEGFRLGQVSKDVKDLYDATKSVLVPDLAEEDFADMFAQTVAYGLFAARVNHDGSRFRRQDAAHLIPPTNPLLRNLFSVVSGPALDDEPFVSFVDDLTQLLGSADMEAILSAFGKREARQDPILHFYEPFLAAYDPSLREQRGVYYTPEPVVSYIVRSVDWLLRERFNCPAGLADHEMTNYEYVDDEGNKTPKQSHRVLVLDPACGTGTFLYAVIDHIREYYRSSGNAGMWNGYVKEHLLKRLFGFELLMAPYAMSHLKLGMQLAALDLPAESRPDWSYEFDSIERLGVYLTNSLEKAESQAMTLYGPLRALTEEANAAAEVKRDLPIMVVLGNPPYSGHSANMSEWITDLVDEYKRGLPDLMRPGQAKWLQDDYVKFMRFAQWRIDKTGAGILGFVTNHGFLDNPTFRGMRMSLMKTFDEIYLLDLHGNAKKKERTPNSGVDQNVFDIQQGVAISLFIRRKDTSSLLARVFHADLWGERETESGGGKYGWLATNTIESTQWAELAPKSPGFLFTPRDESLLGKYESGWSVSEIFSQNGRPAPGIVTTHDQFAISWTSGQAASKVERFLSTSSEDEARTIWRLCSQDQWQYDRAKRALEDGSFRNHIRQILYRPFDIRYTILDKNVAVHRRERVMRHMLAGDNLGLSTTRSIEIQAGFEHVFVSKHITQHHTVSLKEVNYLFPLYIYPSEQEVISGLYQADDRRPNLAPAYVQDLEHRLCLSFIEEGRGDLSENFGPEDVFHYIYAVFHSPTYRQRYDQFLRADFPRVPCIDDIELFRALVGLGRQLTQLHLMESPALNQTGIGFPVPGDYVVESGHPKYVSPGSSLPGQKAPLEEGRAYISKDNSRSGKRGQYFEGISPEVWEFRIGGYQPMEKWLKDRKGRALSFDDLDHYRRMGFALAETGRLMEEIDAAIEDAGGLFA